MIPLHHTQSIHLIYLKVLADLLHHLQLGFISWKLKERVTQLIKLTDDIVILPLPLPCTQQGLSDLISFTFSVQFDQKVYQETHSHQHTLSHTHTYTFDWTKAYRSHHIAHAEHRCSTFTMN